MGTKTGSMIGNGRGRVRQSAQAGLAALLALLLAAAPALCARDAWAADSTATITITNATSGTYHVYQLLTGTFADDDDTALGGDAAVNSSVQSVLLEALATYGHTVTTSGKSTRAVANATMKAIAAVEEDGASQAFANYLAGVLADEDGIEAAATATVDSGTVTFSGLATGYYLVVQEGTTDAAMTSALLVPLSSAGRTIAAKVATPTPSKQVKGTSGEWDGSYGAVADMGIVQDEDGELTESSLTYLVSGTVASNIEDYTQGYFYQFVDELPAALQFSDISERMTWTITATIDDVSADITDGFTGKAVISNNTTVLTWTTSDLIAVLEDAGFESGTYADAVVAVEYTVDFTSDELEAYFAACTSLDDPLTNAVHIVYSNNPYSNGEDSTAKTVEATAAVYSYNLTILKIDEDADALSGAVFTLTRTSGGADAGNLITVDEDGTFVFTGLEADVEYTLTETGVPAGYRSIDPIRFTISATTSTSGDAVTSIAVLEADDPSDAATWSTSGATATVTVVNVEGDDLPLTGAAGTAAGAAAGIALIGCGVAAARSRTAKGTKRAAA